MQFAGIYPVHGWKDKEGLVHMAEASSHDNGTIIEWGQSIGEVLDFTAFHLENLYKIDSEYLTSYHFIIFLIVGCFSILLQVCLKKPQKPQTWPDQWKDLEECFSSQVSRVSRSVCCKAKCFRKFFTKSCPFLFTI